MPNIRLALQAAHADALHDVAFPAGLAHVDDRIIDAGSYRIDAEKLRAVGRMGGYDYARTRDRFSIVRP